MPKHRISELLLNDTHRRSFRGGTQFTLRVLRQEFWIISARSLVRSHINRCVTYVRQQAHLVSQLMGELPNYRVRAAPPFTHTGLDYAGSMLVTPTVDRGLKFRKYYIAVFICLVTKAVHFKDVR